MGSGCTKGEMDENFAKKRKSLWNCYGSNSFSNPQKTHSKLSDFERGQLQNTYRESYKLLIRTYRYFRARKLFKAGWTKNEKFSKMHKDIIVFVKDLVLNNPKTINKNEKFKTEVKSGEKEVGSEKKSKEDLELDEEDESEKNMLNFLLVARLNSTVNVVDSFITNELFSKGIFAFEEGKKKVEILDDVCLDSQMRKKLLLSRMTYMDINCIKDVSRVEMLALVGCKPLENNVTIVTTMTVNDFDAYPVAKSYNRMVDVKKGSGFCIVPVIKGVMLLHKCSLKFPKELSANELRSFLTESVDELIQLKKLCEEHKDLGNNSPLLQ